MSIFSLLSASTVLIYLAVGIYVLRLDTRRGLNRIFFLTTLLLSHWSLAYAFFYSSPDKSLCWLWYKISSPGWCFLPASLLHFFLALTGRKGFLKHRWALPLIYLPAIIFTFQAITGILFVRDFQPTDYGWYEVVAMDSAWYWLFNTYYLGYAVLGFFFTYAWGRASRRVMEQKQSRLIVISGIATILLIMLVNMVFPLLNITSIVLVEPILMIIWISGIWVAITRYRLMSLTPAIAIDKIINQIRDTLILTDLQNRIMLINSLLATMLGFDEKDITGRPVESLFMEKESILETIAMIKQDPQQEVQCELHYQAATTGNLIPVSMSMSAIKDRNDEIIGIVFLGRDIRQMKQLLKEIELRERSEKELRDVEEHYKALIANSTDIITIIDAKGALTFISPSITSVLGYGAESLLHQEPCRYINEQDLDNARSVFTDIVNHPHAGRSRQLRIRHADGSYRMFQVILQNLLDNPSVKGIIANARDITDRKVVEDQLKKAHDELESRVRERTQELTQANERLQQEIQERIRMDEKLRKHSKYLAALHETNLALMNRLQLSDLLNSIVVYATTLLDTPNGYICIVDESQSYLATMAGKGIFEARIGDRIYPHQGLAGKVWQAGHMMTTDNYSLLENRIPGADLDTIASLITIPLKSESGVMGVIGLAHTESGKTFDEEEIALLLQFAQFASIAMDNARLYTSVQQELMERKKAEDALQMTELKYHYLFLNMEDGFAYHKILYDEEKGPVDFICLEANNAFEKITGITKEDLINRRFSEIYTRYAGVHLSRDDGIHISADDQESGEWPRQDILLNLMDIYRKSSLNEEMEGFTDQYSQALERWYTVSNYSPQEGYFATIFHDITERKRLEQSLKHMAHHDILTDLPNRLLFYDRLTQTLAQASRHYQMVAVMILDLDYFKEVNDTYGHDIGDMLLKVVSRKLAGNIRVIDTVARIGGDEFTFILPDIKSFNDVYKIIQRIFHSFSLPVSISTHQLSISPSMGIAIFPTDSRDMETLLKYADIALYRAKDKGRNTYQFYNPSMNPD